MTSVFVIVQILITAIWLFKGFMGLNYWETCQNRAQKKKKKRFNRFDFSLYAWAVNTAYKFHSVAFVSSFFLINSSPERVDSRGSWKSQTTYFGVKLPGISSVGAPKRALSRFAGSRSAPPRGATKPSSQHAVRRHMQNEYKKDVLDSNAVNGGKPEEVTSWYVKTWKIVHQTNLAVL